MPLGVTTFVRPHEHYPKLGEIVKDLLSSAL